MTRAKKRARTVYIVLKKCNYMSFSVTIFFQYSKCKCMPYIPYSVKKHQYLTKPIFTLKPLLIKREEVN